MATKSVFNCAFYDSIDAVYDWNALFDSFPGDLSVNVFRAVWFGVAIAVWAERKERKIFDETKNFFGDNKRIR